MRAIDVVIVILDIAVFALVFEAIREGRKRADAAQKLLLFMEEQQRSTRHALKDLTAALKLSLRLPVENPVEVDPPEMMEALYEARTTLQDAILRDGVDGD